MHQSHSGVHSQFHSWSRLLAVVSAPMWLLWGLPPALAQEKPQPIPRVSPLDRPPPGVQPGLRFTDQTGTPLEEIIQRLYLTASARVRPEYNENFTDFNSSTDDEIGFISSRFRLGVGADLLANTGLFLEAQNNSFWGDEARFLGINLPGEDDLAIYQGYGEIRRIGGSPFGVRVGRQELVYGTELLLGDADFGPGLSHDAVKVTFDGRLTDDMPFSIHAWYAKELERNVATLPLSLVAAPDPGDEDADFYGVYTKLELWKGTGIEPYYLFLRNALTGVEDKRHTVGARGFMGITKRLAVNAEFAYQFGDTAEVVGTGEEKIRAFAFEAGVNINLEDGPLSPEIEFGYAWGSGDNDPADSTSETFNPLFQDNHPRLGLSDLFFLENLHALSVHATVKPAPKWTVGGGYYAFWADEPEDTVGPRGLQGPGAADSSFIGHELNAHVDLNYSKGVGVQLAWAWLIPDDYVDERFADTDDAHRLYVHMFLGF